MKTKLHYVFSLALILLGFSLFGQENYFSKTEFSLSENFERSEINQLPTKFNTYSIDQVGLRNALSNAPVRGESFSSNLILQFPNLKGELESYQIYEASVMHPDLQAQYPEIRSYAGYGLENPSNYLRFSISPHKGLSGIILSGEKDQSLIIDPLPSNLNSVMVFSRSNKRKNENSFICSTIDELQNEFSNNENRILSADATLHTFDLAMSVSGEYSVFHGGTLPLVNAAIATTLTRVNGIYETDFNVNMVLVANNDLVVYLDPVTDPYDGTSDALYNSTLQSTLDANIGSAGYDVGHLMAGIGNNGNAGCIGCICVDGQKGSGFTTSTNPIGDTFDVDYVAHELGHQFGGNHTFTHSSEGVGIAQMEPGSGSTIMGYAGITGATDVQSNSDPYFHAISIQQITTHVASRTCDVETATGNNVPVANAGSDLTLPIGTPFILEGSATDADSGDNLTYCWEQFDEFNGNGGGFPDETSTNSNLPLFRSYTPVTNGTRTFPELQSLLNNGVNGNTWEKVPTVSRSADFRLTVRDNRPFGGANDFDDMVVTWDATYGPFEVTSQNTNGIMWTRGGTETINWNVNNTTSLTGSTNVNILLSTDGGMTFPTTLAANTPNDGTEIITVPNIAAPYCRIMIEPTGNSYFAVNTEDFSIDYILTTNCNQYVSTDPNLPLAIDDNGANYTQVSSLTVSESTSITDINVGVNITHPWIGDLLIGIQSPAGTLLNMMEPYDPCQNEDNDVIVKFDDDGAAFSCSITGDNLVLQSQQDALSGWNGEDSAGQWLIGVGDFGAADVGTLNSWYIEVCTVTETLSSPEFNSMNSLTVSPNPNNGQFEIKFNSTINNNIQVEIYDTLGRQIFQQSFTSSGNFNRSIDLGEVQTGVYFVNITNGIQKVSKKIVVN